MERLWQRHNVGLLARTMTSRGLGGKLTGVLFLFQVEVRGEQVEERLIRDGLLVPFLDC